MKKYFYSNLFYQFFLIKVNCLFKGSGIFWLQTFSSLERMGMVLFPQPQSQPACLPSWMFVYPNRPADQIVGRWERLVGCQDTWGISAVLTAKLLAGNGVELSRPQCWRPAAWSLFRCLAGLLPASKRGALSHGWDSPPLPVVLAKRTLSRDLLGDYHFKHIQFCPDWCGSLSGVLRQSKRSPVRFQSEHVPGL